MWKYILVWILLLFIDTFLYLRFGLIAISYDDFNLEPPPLLDMPLNQVFVIILFFLFMTISVVTWCYLLYKLYKKLQRAM